MIVNYNTKDYNGMTRLHHAVMDETLDNIIELINLGVNVNETDDIGWTPLHHAIYRDHADKIEVVKVLIKAGANVNATTNFGSTVLHFACESTSNLECAKLFIQLGVDINLSDNDGTPLHYAIINNNVEMIKLLLSHKVNSQVFNDKDELTIEMTDEIKV